VKRLFWLLWKDAVTELRSFERISTLALFSVAVLLTLHFSLPPESTARPKVAAGFLWAALLFAAMLELRRSFESELRDGTLDALRASPLDPALLYAAKVVSSLIVLVVLIVVLVPLTALFFSGRMSAVPAAIGVAALGALGLVAWGTLFAAVSSGARGGEVILPVLLFPLVVPQTIACVRLLAFYLSGERLAGPTTGFVLLGAFDLLSIGTSLLLFDYVLEE
jgi:heme exporter protein B